MRSIHQEGAMRSKTVVCITGLAVCLLLLPSLPARAADAAAPHPRRAERQERRAANTEARPDRAVGIGAALQALAETGAADIAKRARLKKDLAAGTGVNTALASARLTLPFVSRQHDGWSCGLHAAARLLAYRHYDVSYEQLMRQRKFAALQFNSDKGPYTLPPALQRILRSRHPDSWWLQGADLNAVKNLLRQHKPVAALIALPGSYTVKLAGMNLKAQATHWIVVSGFDDATQTIYYHDPLKEGEQCGFHEGLGHRSAGFPG
jgi:hypothetical protein